MQTLFAVLFWLAFSPWYVALIAPYSMYDNAYIMAVTFAICGGLAVHLWPTRTSPWRTLAWACWLSATVGASVLLLGGGRVAFPVATAAGTLLARQLCDEPVDLPDRTDRQVTDR